MDPISNESMGNATSLFNLVRNLGGSIGIAAVSTIQTRREQVDINVLGAGVSPHNPNAVAMVNSLRHFFVAQGADSVMAMRQTQAAIFGMVRQQASMISYNTTFRILGIVFLGMIPFVLLMKRPRKRGPAAAH
jgi:DHA2 family multidrug resistance protein